MGHRRLVPLCVLTLLVSTAAAGAGVFVIAALLWKFGPPIRDFVEKYLGLVATAFVVLLIGGFVAIKYVL